MNDKTRLFIEKNLNADIRQLALQAHRESDIDLPLALRQIAGRQTARRKLPSWAALDGLLFPPHLNMEQCSSEQTARYKADICRRLLNNNEENKLVDLTGGFGVDFAWMSEAFEKAVYVERDSDLFAISSQNFKVLNKQVETHNTDGIDYLHQLEHATMIFLDPARRDDKGARTYGMADCTPNVLEIKDELLQKADLVMLKLSPMLDWRKTVNDLGESNVREVHIVSVQNECKELLIVLASHNSCVPSEASDQRSSAPITIFCINILSDGSCQQFLVPSPSSIHHPLSSLHPSCVPSVASEQSSSAPITIFCINILSDGSYQQFLVPSPSSIHHPLSSLHLSPFTCHHYLYEPNASIMKAGCFQELAQYYGIQPLAPNSHLFVSEQPIETFPGRQFQISAISSMNKKELKTALGHLSNANITVRNFPLSVPELRKKLKLSEGGNTYIFATTLANNQHILLVCNPIKG